MDSNQVGHETPSVEDMLATFQCCLAQSGNPVSLSAVGGGRVMLDFDDSQLADVLKLAPYRDTPLLVCVFAGGGELTRRHGGKREGAGRPHKVQESEQHNLPDGPGDIDC